MAKKPIQQSMIENLDFQTEIHSIWMDEENENDLQDRLFFLHAGHLWTFIKAKQTQNC